MLTELRSNSIGVLCGRSQVFGQNERGRAGIADECSVREHVSDSRPEGAWVRFEGEAPAGGLERGWGVA